jgi:hypothetical protein
MQLSVLQSGQRRMPQGMDIGSNLLRGRSVGRGSGRVQQSVAAFRLALLAAAISSATAAFAVAVLLQQRQHDRSEAETEEMSIAYRVPVAFMLVTGLHLRRTHTPSNPTAYRCSQDEDVEPARKRPNEQTKRLQLTDL